VRSLSQIVLGRISAYDAILHTLTLIRYLGVVVGRPQNLLRLSVRITADQQVLQVYSTMLPKHRRSKDERNPHVADLLINAVEQPEAFSRILENWLVRDQAWRAARGRFFNSSSKGRYDHDRLIAAANVFDILPSSAVPPKTEISEQLEAAKNACRDIFKALPDSPERSSVLGELGRVGKSRLKQKIRYRAQPLVDAMDTQLPELLLVTDEAVNCRNYYVHGGKRRFDYECNFEMVTFFTDTLEFVFVASDLIEAGWDVMAWARRGSMMTHPVGTYRIAYREHLQRIPVIWQHSLHVCNNGRIPAA
jgi:hypothetical protein